MNPKPKRCTLAGGAAVALALLVSQAAFAAQSETPSTAATPLVLAQGSPSPERVASLAGLPDDAVPAYLRRVRMAAAEGPEALRRYIWRTRMMYDFNYNDFAPLAR